MGKLKSLLTGLALGALIGSLLDPKRRQRAKKIALELKSKVTAKAKAVSELSRDAYEKLVDSAAEEMKDAKSVTKEEMDKIVAELKSGWNEVRASFKK